jgi:hypothetical protein
MNLFDEKSEKKVVIAIIASIPVVLFVQWKQNGTLGKTEIIITLITILIAIGILYFIKWYSNKK